MILSAALLTSTDRPKSVHNRFVIEVCVGLFVLSRCFLDFSVGEWVFVIELSQISSFFCQFISYLIMPFQTTPLSCIYEQA